MAVYIPGINKPEKCGECMAFVCYKQWSGDSGDCFCGLTKEDVYRDSKPRDDCPLTPLPKHGDLIDRDVLHEFQQGRELPNGAYQRYVSMPIVEKMKPVIPADWGDK